MFVNLDVIIVLIFLATNLTLGVWSGRGIRNITDYAIGKRDFSTATIASTIIATWISGSFFTICVSQTYKDGVWFLPPVFGAILSLLIVGHIFAPRMQEFLGSLSVAETMGQLFGTKVRVITAIASIAQAVAFTALQIKVFSTVFSYFFEFPTLYATCVSSVIVIFYSAWGGIKAVTFTDVIQFFTFGIFIPLFLVFIGKTFVSADTVAHAFKTNPLLDYTQLLNVHDPKFLPNLGMFVWFIIPAFSSPIFQRMLMARSTTQIKQSFTIAAFGYGVMVLLMCAIGVVVLSANKNIDSDNIVMYVLDNYSFEGLRGITLIGIMAMIMSSADSWINSGSVIFSHDLCKPLGIKIKDELLVSRIFAVVAGFSALILVLLNENLIKLFSLQASFYMPVVTGPLILAILGFRTTTRTVIWGIIAGFTVAFLWKIYIQPINGFDSVVPGLVANVVTLISLHYLLGEPGGWVGAKNSSDDELSGKSRKKKWQIKSVIKTLRNFDLFKYCFHNTPKHPEIYTYFAISLLTTMITTLMMPQEIYKQNIIVVNILQGSALLISAVFITQKLWNESFQKNYAGLIWHISIFLGLAFISTFLALISKLSYVSAMVLITNLTIIGYLVDWRAAIAIIILGAYTALICYINFVAQGVDVILELRDMEWNLSYILFSMIGMALIFIKPQQENEERVAEHNAYLENMMQYKDSELQKAINIKYEFLRNLEHESRTPITGIASLGEVLWDSYDLLSEEQRRKGLEDIAESSKKLSSLVNNIVDLSRLSKMTESLTIEKVNLSRLVLDRLEICKKLYLKDKRKDLNFAIRITPDLYVNCDLHYITRVLDNLIINAICYSSFGEIMVSLKIDKKGVKFSIKDEGIGIPKEELYDVFGAFFVGSKTRTPAGGRGVGLALCKKSIEAHNGTIWAESDGDYGATFSFVIPL